MTNGRELAKVLDWDTNHFGFKIARVMGDTLNSVEAQHIDEWSYARGVRCLYFLCSAADIDSIRAAEQSDYRLTDIRITYEHSRKEDWQPIEPRKTGDIRPYQTGDLPALEKISLESKFDTRFAVDPGFPPEKSSEMYVIWIRNSCQGSAQQVLVACVEGQPAGYISCHTNAEGTIGQIGLVTVAPSAQGRGIGNQLVTGALSWFHDQHVAKVTVVTQGRNRLAQRLYERCGFLIDNMQFWYHKWYTQ